MKKLCCFIYCAAFFAVCLFPSLGMFYTDQEPSVENRTLTEFPSLVTGEGINVEWLGQAGTYFQEHFAFRNELVTANALLNGKVLGVSTASGVICGKDGWLYYKDSLSDYLGTDLMSDRSLYNLAHSLAMMQDDLNRRGIHFLFTVAPNKNSLYGEYMPYYDSWKVSEEKNVDRLKKYLEQEHVAYVDLYEVLKSEEVLYHKRDSHWNQKGAAKAADALLAALGKAHDSYESETYQVHADFEGDLDKMLYPLAIEPEEEIYYDKMTTYAYVGEVESNFDPRITTVNPVRSGSLVMYRDSFGNALLPFLADAYDKAYFTRGVPYLLSDVEQAESDSVIVECAERFLPDRAASPPQMEAHEVTWDGAIIYSKEIMSVPDPESRNQESERRISAVQELQMTEAGLMVQITGWIRGDLPETDAQIYVRVNGGRIYEACPSNMVLEDGTVNDNGFSLYLSTDVVLDEENLIEIMIRDEDTLTVIAQEQVMVTN